MADKKSIFSAGNAATDDYASRRAPKSWSWGYFAIALPITGGGTASLWLAYGAIFEQTYGTANLYFTMVFCMILQTIITYLLASIAAKYRMGTDLATRGLGLGFNGSIITNIIYAFEWIYFWAAETQILGAGISAAFGIPDQVAWVVVGIGVFVPLTIFGMKFITKFQNWTIPIFLVWIIINVVMVFKNPDFLANSKGFTTYMPEGMSFGGIPLIQLINSLVGTVGIVALLTMEFARGARPDDSPSKRRWGLFWVALLPQNLFTWLIYVPLGGLLWKATGQANPGDAFVALTGVFGALGLLLTQIRINVQNTYAESLALSSLASKLHINWGRSVWSVIACILGTITVFANILGHLALLATIAGIMLFSWMGMLFSDYYVVRGVMKLDVGEVEHRRAYLRSVNIIGFSSMIIATVVALVLLFGPQIGITAGDAGALIAALTCFIAFAIAFVVHAILAKIVVKSTFNPYLARTPEEVPASLLDNKGELRCAHCDSVVGPEDVARCPLDENKWICSACCAGNRHCGTACQNPSTQTN